MMQITERSTSFSELFHRQIYAERASHTVVVPDNGSVATSSGVIAVTESIVFGRYSAVIGPVE
jgi:hypothetical protein